MTVEYHWLEGQYYRLPALMADLVRRQVAVIASPFSLQAATEPARHSCHGSGHRDIHLTGS